MTSLVVWAAQILYYERHEGDYYIVRRFQSMVRRGGSRYASKLFGCSLPIRN
jgi:hypothetical protein